MQVRREERYPFAAALAVALVLFPVTLVPAMLIVLIAARAVVGESGCGVAMPRNEFLAGAIRFFVYGAPLMIAYAAARFGFSLVRWRRVVSPDYCQCGYDLTGNVSGVCSECGTPVPGPATVQK